MKSISTFFRVAGKRISAPFTSNPIEHFVNSRNHHVGITAEHDGEDSTTNRGPLAAYYLYEFIEIVNGCNDTQKREFLQGRENQRVLFDLINGLLLFFTDGDCNYYHYEFIDNLIELLTLDKGAETSFYHSQSFQRLCLKDILASLYSDGKSKTNLVRNFVFEAINKYPNVESALFTSENIQKLATSVYWESNNSELDQLARLLLVLSSTKRYLSNKLTNQTILESIDLRFSRSIFKRGSYNRKHGIFYSSILVAFLDDPTRLSHHILSQTQRSLHILDNISDVEQILRSKGILANMRSLNADYLQFSLSPQERLDRLMLSLQPAVKQTYQWALSSKLHGLSQTVKQAYGLYQYLQEESNQQNYITLLEKGFSPDFTQRMMVHDMTYPALIPALLEAENHSQSMFIETPQSLTR